MAKVKITEDTLRNMVKESVKKVLNEEPALALNYYAEPLLEMARVDDPRKDSNILGTKEIWIYGNDRSSMSPHFHYFDKRSSNGFDIEVKIADLTVCYSQPRKGVKANELLSWKGLSDAHKALIKWINSPNSDMPSVTNYDALKMSWNQNNRSNPI